jgi:ketosteroid isomerase-like protein
MDTTMTTSTWTPVETVGAVYAAFARGDVPGLLGLLSDDVVLEDHGPGVTTTAQDAGHPLLVGRRGRTGAAEFFTEAARMQVHEFTVHELLGRPGSPTVAVLVTAEMSYPSGARFRDDEVHLWTVGADGRATALRHVVDTGKHLAAWRGPAAPGVPSAGHRE